jgi:lipid-A-disaccharide synthase-like uncharacterized protein
MYGTKALQQIRYSYTMTENSSEIIGPDHSGHLLSVDGLPVGALRAIIAKLNERSQAATRTYTNNYDRSVNDIRQILQKIQQEFKGRTILSMSATVSLFLTKGQRHDFASWQEFDEFDTSQKERTRSISLEVVIDVLDGNDGSPERYQCQVSVQNNPSSFGFVIGPISISNIESAGLPPTPIAATVKYNNYVVGKNLLGTIDDWESTLKQREQSLLKKLQRYSSYVNQLLVFLGSISGIIFAYRFLPFFIDSQNWQAWVTWFILIAVMFWQVASICGRLAERYIDRRQDPANIIITSGDQRAEDLRSKKNKSLAKKAILSASIVAIEVALAIMIEPIARSIMS